MTIYQIEIGYKSGGKITEWFKDFKITTGLSVEWKEAYGNKKIIFINPDEIEYIIQIDTKELPQ